MAEAGDGQQRSETRRKTARVTVRITPSEKTRIERHAARLGHATPAAYMRAVALKPAERSPRDRRIAGVIGLIGGWMSDADALLASSHAAGATSARNRARAIAALLRDFMEDPDDCEDHQDAT